VSFLFRHILNQRFSFYSCCSHVLWLTCAWFGLEPCFSTKSLSLEEVQTEDCGVAASICSQLSFHFPIQLMIPLSKLALYELASSHSGDDVQSIFCFLTKTLFRCISHHSFNHRHDASHSFSVLVSRNPTDSRVGDLWYSRLLSVRLQAGYNSRKTDSFPGTIQPMRWSTRSEMVKCQRLRHSVALISHHRPRPLH
jgi:hypothetical protein